MSGYGQFCSIARAHDALGGRWTLLIVRELLCGSRRFSDIRRGIPRISRTMLAERLQALDRLGAVRRSEGRRGPEYVLTPAGLELEPLVVALGTWGQRWLPRHAAEEDVDVEPVFIDIQRRVRTENLPPEPVVVRFEVDGSRRRFLLLRRTEASFCAHNPGFPESLVVRSSRATLVGWWRGDLDLAGARRMGLSIEGPRALVRSFPSWFARYLLADVKARA
ncbi:MAG: helix-turn-helix transcriptional regulator [Alphaproteobacteria bacterium]|nr:helix-turn-helix transcriptional regulator [Alphaproteobacteria bacterium]